MWLCCCKRAQFSLTYDMRLIVETSLSLFTSLCHWEWMILTKMKHHIKISIRPNCNINCENYPSTQSIKFFSHKKQRTIDHLILMAVLEKKFSLIQVDVLYAVWKHGLIGFGCHCSLTSIHSLISFLPKTEIPSRMLHKTIRWQQTKPERRTTRNKNCDSRIRNRTNRRIIDITSELLLLLCVLVFYHFFFVALFFLKIFVANLFVA